MTNTSLKNQKENRVRYRIQVRPEKTMLVAEFDKNQVELLERFIDLLLHMETKQDNKVHDTDTNIGGNELNAVVSGKRRGTAAASG